MKIKKISILTAFALFFTGALFAQTQTIQLKKGQKFLVENRSLTETTTELQGQIMDIKMDVTATYEIEVEDVKDDQYHLANKISKIKMNMSQMGQEINFDSDKKEDLEGPMGAAIKDIINVMKKVILSKEGKVISTGDDSLENTNPNLPLKQFEEAGYGAAIAFQAIPGNLKTGQTWNATENQEGTVRNTTYNVKSVSGKSAAIDLKGDLDVDTKMENMGMEMTVKSKGTFTGEEVVDTNSGVIQSQNMIINSDGNIEVMGQELPTSTKITSNTTVKVL